MTITTDVEYFGGYSWQIVINIVDGTSDAYTAKLAKIGTFSIGDDNDSDLIYFPSNFNPTIIPLPYTITTYNTVLEKLMNYDSSAKIKRGGVDYYVGTVYDRMYGNPIEKTIKLKIIDQVRDLKGIAPKDNPLGLGLGSNVVGVMNLVKQILNHGEQTPYIADVTSNSPIQVESSLQKYVGGPYYIGTIDGNYLNEPLYPSYRYPIAVYESFYFSATNNPYSNMVDVVKSILAGFGCVGVYLPMGEFAMVSRFHNPSGQILTLNVNDYELIEEETIPKMVGMKSKVFTGGAGSYQEKDAGIVDENLINKERYEELRIDHAGGTLPVSGSFVGVGVIIPAALVPAANDTFFMARQNRSRFTDSGTWLATWEVVHGKSWSLINVPRRKLKVKVHGTDLSFKDYYVAPHYSARAFRAVKMDYDYGANKTAMTLKVC